MPNLVIDSSVAVKWFVPEPYSTEARRILDEYQKGVISFLAPDLINAEVGNIVWKKHLLQGLAAADAQAVIDDFRTLQFTFIPMADLLDKAYKAAVKHKRTVYDSLYLVLSVREGCQFVTEDEKLVNAVGASFSNLIWLGIGRRWTPHLTTPCTRPRIAGLSCARLAAGDVVCAAGDAGRYASSIR